MAKLVQVYLLLEGLWKTEDLQDSNIPRLMEYDSELLQKAPTEIWNKSKNEFEDAAKFLKFVAFLTRVEAVLRGRTIEPSWYKIGGVQGRSLRNGRILLSGADKKESQKTLLQREAASLATQEDDLKDRLIASPGFIAIFQEGVKTELLKISPFFSGRVNSAGGSSQLNITANLNRRGGSIITTASVPALVPVAPVPGSVAEAPATPPSTSCNIL